LITKNKVKVDYFKRLPPNQFNAMKINDIKVFKQIAYQNFLSSPFNNFFKQTKINKLYVAIDIFENYDLMLTDTIGKSFEKLNYFKRKINVVKVFNPIDFFAIKTISQSDVRNKVTPYLISSNSKNNFPFSKDVFVDFGDLEFNCLKNIDLNNRGIAHIIGHGNLKLEKDNRSLTNVLQSRQLKSMLNQYRQINTDLFVLNFCFGAHKREMFYPDRDLQNNLISKGTKAVIASPYETVDQSSAWIFKKFYSYLNKGIIVEDALHKAKLDYLRCHKGTLAHPIYWSTYELTTNVRHLKLKLESDEKSDFSKRILLVSSILFLLLVISFFIFKLFRKSPLN
jgi:hypothetical protein